MWYMRFFVLLLWPLVTSGAEVQVSPGGDLAGSIAALGPGDTLVLAGGTYTDVLAGVQWPSGTSWEAPVKVMGAPGAVAIIKTPWDGSTSAMLTFSGPQYVWLDNLVLDAADWSKEGSNNGALNVVKVTGGSSHIRLSNSVLKNALDYFPDSSPPGGSKGILDTSQGSNEYLNLEITNNRGYGIYNATANNLIEGCYIHDNWRFGLHLYNDGGGVNNNVVRGNRIVHNGLKETPPQSGMVVASGSGNQIEGNVFDGNGASGIQNDAEGTTITGNTIVNHPGPCISGDDSMLAQNTCEATGTAPPLPQPPPPGTPVASLPAPTGLRLLPRP